MRKWIWAGIFYLVVSGFVVRVEAEPWTLPKGELFAGVTLTGTRSRSLFNNEADKVAFLNNGLSRVGGVGVEGAYGVSDRMTVSVSVPLLLYSLKDDFVREEGASLGDIRGAIRYRLINRIIVSVIELGVKFPTATEADPARIQVGEGQYDVEVIWSAGWHQAILPVNVGIGYRYRMRNSDSGFKPGDEIPFRIGTNCRLLDRVFAALSLEGFWGRAGNARVFDLSLPASRSTRKLISLSPSISFSLTDRIVLNVSASAPLIGRNYNAGRIFLLGMSFGNTGARSGTGGAMPSPRGGSCCAI